MERSVGKIQEAVVIVVGLKAEGVDLCKTTSVTNVGSTLLVYTDNLMEFSSTKIRMMHLFHPTFDHLKAHLQTLVTRPCPLGSDWRKCQR